MADNPTTVKLGMLPVNRGEYSNSNYYYKDNIVQYNGSSYIYSPANFDIDDPAASKTSEPPYNTYPDTLNTGWHKFATGNNTFTTHEQVEDLGIDSVPTDSSSNLVTSGGVKSAIDNVMENSALRYDEAQTLTSEQKAQALANVGISGIDSTPTAGSKNLVESGGVQNELALGAVYDVSAHNNGVTFDSLNELLSAANLNILIPTNVRKGGMSIKFVQSSDNNSSQYVQYRLMADSWSTVVTDWQGVDDEPTAGSDNLVKSGGVDKVINGEIVEIAILSSSSYNGYVDSNGRIQGYSTLRINKYPIEAGKTYNIVVEKATNSAGYELSYAETLTSNPVQPITEAGMGTASAFSYTYTASDDGFLIVGSYANTTEPSVKEVSFSGGIKNVIEQLEEATEDLSNTVEGVEETLEDIDEQINGSIVEVTVESELTKADRYCAIYNNKIEPYTNNNLSIVYFKIYAGKEYSVSVAKTCNSAGYILSYAETTTASNITPIINDVGNRAEFNGSFTAESDGYLVVGISTDSSYTTVKTYENGDSIKKDIVLLKKGGLDWSDKKWFVIGDSLSTLNSTTTKRYIDYITELTGINVVVRAIGGSSWGQPQLNDNAFFQQAEDTTEDTDIVTIFGSFNSWYKMSGGVITDGPTSPGDIDSVDVSTRYGCINKVFTNIFANAPLAKVGVIYPTPWSSSNPYEGSETADSLITMLENATQRWGIPTLDLYHRSGMRPWDESYRELVYSKDTGGIDGNPAGVHPNEIGHKIIASHVLEFMKTLLL